MSIESPSETREQIARRVLRTVYENTESWERGQLGTSLAYLAMAILEGDTLDLTYESEAHVFAILDPLFYDSDVVWQFIKKPAPIDDRIPWRPTLTIGGPTCAKMAENGETIMRQYCTMIGLEHEPPDVIIGDLLSDIAHALVKAGCRGVEDVLQDSLGRALTCLSDETDVSSHIEAGDEVPPIEPYAPAEFLIGCDEEESE